MILSGNEIVNAIVHGDIKIEPFYIDNLNSNSYDLTLHNELLIYDEAVLDPKRINKTKKFILPKVGITIFPGQLYLGRTVEYTETRNYVPGIEGRSSFARLGLTIHASAGFGDVGFCGSWTLEISCIHPIVLYPNMQICQIFYHEVTKGYSEYSGKYQNQIEAGPSKIHEEL